MRIVFMGTPDFAAASLERLYGSIHEIVAVFTQPDKPKNRGMKLEASAVKVLAEGLGLPVYQPVGLKDGEAEKILRALEPDMIVVVAYGKILPPAILDVPKFGCINVHASLLPKYRGAAPIQWSVLNGDRVTGVTIMYMAQGLDTGDIISQRETEILPDETSGELFERLQVIGAQLLTDTVEEIFDGRSTRTKQDESLVTYAPPLSREMSPIDWTKSGREIKNHVRGLLPWPVATTEIEGRAFKIYEVRPIQGEGNAQCGSVVETDQEGIHIACGDGTVIIKQLQAAGKKRMNAADYLRGNPFS